MAKTRTPLEPWQLEDAARLKLLWDAHRQKTKATQEQFGLDTGIGNQGAIWQYLNARIALNADSATRFARGMGIEVKDFSPRLATQIGAMAKTSGAQDAAKPGELLVALTSREEVCIERFRQISPAQQDAVLTELHNMITGNIESQKIFKKKLRHIGDSRIEREFGFPADKTSTSKR